MKTVVIAMLVATPVIAAQTGPAAPAAPSPGTTIFDKAVNQPGIGWTLYGDGQTAMQVPATDVPGGGAVRIQVGRAGSHPWDIGATYPTVKPIASGDTVLVMVYLRAPNAKDGAAVAVPIGATGADAPYTQIAGETVQVGAAWKRYFAAGPSSQSFAAGKARIAIQLAGAKQVLEVGPGFLFDLGPGFDATKLPHN